MVIATGFEQHPQIPPFAADLSPAITQMHSSGYRNPESLPQGGVLIVGSAQSGGQIAEELYQPGARCSCASAARGACPRRYRGKDVIAWLTSSASSTSRPTSCPCP